MEEFYYPKTIRNIVVAVNDMFNNIQVKRYDSSNNVVKTINVPITFGPVKKFQQIREESEDGTKYYLQLPRLAIVLNGITYSADRATGVNEVRYWFDQSLGISATNTFSTDIQPTPYDFSFTLYVRTDSLTDFSQIMENILPYFNPSLYLRVKEFSFLNIERDLQVTLDSVTPEFISEEIADDTTRQINGQVGFVVKGFLYRPIASSKIIKIINTGYFIDEYTTSGSLSGVQASDYTITSADGGTTSGSSNF